jgi:hypothetical protein
MKRRFDMQKEPGEILPPSIDFALELAKIHASEQISSVSVSAIDTAGGSDASAILDGDPVVGNGDGTNSKVTQPITGGVDGKIYKITIKATTNNSNTLDVAPVLHGEIIVAVILYHRANSLEKQPAEIIPPSIDFAPELTQIHASEEIDPNNVTVTAVNRSDGTPAPSILDGDPVVGNGDGTNSKVLQNVKAGDDGDTYIIVIAATTDNNNGYDNAPILHGIIVLSIVDL